MSLENSQGQNQLRDTSFVVFSPLYTVKAPVTLDLDATSTPIYKHL